MSSSKMPKFGKMVSSGQKKSDHPGMYTRGWQKTSLKICDLAEISVGLGMASDVVVARTSMDCR